MEQVRGVDWFLRYWAVCFLALLTATLPLWIRGTFICPLPELYLGSVPVFGFMNSVSKPLQDGISAILFFSLILALLGIVFRPGWFRRLGVPIFILTCILVVFDQNRFQAWIIVFLFSALQILFRRDQKSEKGAMGWLIIVIYLFSGISKLNFQFTNSLGPALLQSVLSLGGLTFEQGKPSYLIWASFLMPILEIVAAGMLMTVKLRKFGFAIAGLMHLFLILVLGPSGLNNQFGVLFWNLFFLGWIWYCFGDSFTNVDSQEATPQKKESSPFRSTSITIPTAVPLLATILGFGGWIQWVDPWPAWELYSPSSSRVHLSLPDSAIDQLDQELRSYFVEQKGQGDEAVVSSKQTVGVSQVPASFRRLDLRRLSLDTLNAPVYPHWRIQLVQCIEICERLKLARGICLEIKSKSDRWTGARTSKVFYSLDAAKRELKN